MIQDMQEPQRNRAGIMKTQPARYVGPLPWNTLYKAACTMGEELEGRVSQLPHPVHTTVYMHWRRLEKHRYRGTKERHRIVCSGSDEGVLHLHR